MACDGRAGHGICMVPIGRGMGAGDRSTCSGRARAARMEAGRRGGGQQRIAAVWQRVVGQCGGESGGGVGRVSLPAARCCAAGQPHTYMSAAVCAVRARAAAAECASLPIAAIAAQRPTPQK